MQQPSIYHPRDAGERYRFVAQIVVAAVDLRTNGCYRVTYFLKVTAFCRFTVPVTVSPFYLAKPLFKLASGLWRGHLDLYLGLALKPPCPGWPETLATPVRVNAIDPQNCPNNRVISFCLVRIQWQD